MILEFSFSNFGPVHDRVTLSFEATNDDTLGSYYITKLPDGTRVLKLGIIYGPNASGKTNILNALQMLRDLVLKPLDQKTDPIRYHKHKLGTAVEEDTRFNLTFYLDEIKYDYDIVFNNQFIRREVLNYYPKNKKALFYEREYDGKVSTIEFGSTLENIQAQDTRNLEANTIKNVTVMGAYSKTNVSIPILDSLIGWFDNNFLPIISPEDKENLFSWTSGIIDRGVIQKKQVVEFLKNADLNITDLNIVEDEISISDQMLEKIEQMPIPDEAKREIKERKKLKSLDVEFLHEFKGQGSEKLTMTLPKEEESNGTRRYFQLVGPLLMALKSNSFLFIDEIETSLHPDLLEQLVVNFLENSDFAQLLFTTHNISLLTRRDILRNDAIWFTEKNEKGATDLFSLSDFKSDKIRKTSSIFNAYDLGKLGAKPKTKPVTFTDG
ncbi:MAG: ATP-binding protein [Balneolaceae bacterium]|nr:ATP-binding protein [Balneolaceae bacterium]